MRKIIHVSDLHFGKAERAVINGLLASLREIQPHLVIVSGDLTQRARKNEFEEAKLFFEELVRQGLPYFVIPGNHDIEPVYRPARLFNAYKNYRRYISAHTEPFYHDGELAVASINTVKRTHLVNGRIERAQIAQVQEWFAQFGEETVKIIVTHHPLHRLPDRTRKIAWKAKRTVRALKTTGVNVYLAGHFHRSSAENAGAIVVQAGTVSTRQRGELPSFNTLTIDMPRMEIGTLQWNAEEARFCQVKRREFDFAAAGDTESVR